MLAQKSNLALGETVVNALACPDCRCRLKVAPQDIACPECERKFYVTDTGLPILFSKDSEFYGKDAEFYERQVQSSERTDLRDKTSRLRRFRMRLLPKTTPYKLTTPYLEQAIRTPAEGIIVNLGSGARETRPDAGWVNVDIMPQHHCDIVADAHWLPFVDNSAAAVVSTNVFEYLWDPFSAAAEIKRVLAPGGMVFVNVAFLLPLSTPDFLDSTPDYQDRFRFTAEGLLSLFGDLEVIKIGPSSGPIMALVRLLDRTVDLAVPGRFLSFPVRLLLAWILHPFKFLDPLILKRDVHGLSAAGFFILAKKRS